MATNKIMQKLSCITAALVIGMASCATSVPIKSVKMPTIDTTGIQRLAIKPFDNASGVGGTVAAQLTRYLTDQAAQRITSAGKFTMVAPTDPNAEGVFTGSITNIGSKDSQEKRERKDKDGKTYIEIIYHRDVSLEFSYSIISSRTDMPIGTVYKKGSTRSSSSESHSKLADTTTLGKQIVDDQIRNLNRDIVPYIVSTNRKLMTETSKDKEVKEKMKAALALVKNGNYTEAITQYDAISSEHDSYAARANAGLLREAIASDIAARDQLTQLFNAKDGLVEKAIKHAIDTLYSKLPAGANITIMKISSRERDRLDYVMNQMSKTIVQENKLVLIDRSNQALIDAEVNLQLSGSVSDDSIISIGHQLGVQYIVLCGISGEKSFRRFNLKVLNIETTQITVQTDSEI